MLGVLYLQLIRISCPGMDQVTVFDFVLGRPFQEAFPICLDTMNIKIAELVAYAKRRKECKYITNHKLRDACPER